MHTYIHSAVVAHWASYSPSISPGAWNGKIHVELFDIQRVPLSRSLHRILALLGDQCTDGRADAFTRTTVSWRTRFIWDCNTHRCLRDRMQHSPRICWDRADLKGGAVLGGEGVGGCDIRVCGTWSTCSTCQGPELCTC